MSNLRQRIFDELKITNAKNSNIEEILGFQKGDIFKFIHADWYNLGENFSPFTLSKYLSIPIEEYHYGYFIGFKGKEDYIQYMNIYKDSLMISKNDERQSILECPECGYIGKMNKVSNKQS